MRIRRENNPVVLIADDFHPFLLRGLDRLGLSFSYEPEIGKEKILETIGNYQGFIVRSKVQCDKEFFDKAKQLKWIAKGGSGMDNIDEKEAEKKGIVLINAPEGNRTAVAEHTLGMILSLANNLSRSFSEVKALHWNREANRGVELESKTLGIIGFGNAGSSLAKKVSGFGMKVIAYDKYLGNFQSPYAKAVGLDKIFREADWLSLHIPLTEETRSMVNTVFLEKFSKAVGLINASRGEIVVSEDVLNALRLGKLFAFGADVLENEKPARWTTKEKSVYQKLLAMQNVLVTPHIAGWTVESYRKIAEVIVAKLEEL